VGSRPRPFFVIGPIGKNSRSEDRKVAGRPAPLKTGQRPGRSRHRAGKATAEKGPIRVGSLLVTSSRPGHDEEGADRSQMLGSVVGEALEPLGKGTGVIPVLVTLQ